MARSSLKFFTGELGYRNADFHDDLYDFLQYEFGPSNPTKKYLVLWPRKHGKSECIAINYISWLIGKYPDIHITLVSKTASLAEQSVLAVKTRIEHDPHYLTIFPNVKPPSPDKWTNTELIVKRPTISKFPTLYATGLKGPLTGGGNDLIIADDLIDEEDIITPLAIERADTWFHKVLLTTLFPQGAVIVIGTRWGYKDLYTALLEKWPQSVRQAILLDAQGKETTNALWPAYWSYDKLVEKRNDLGTLIFNCQMQNDPSGMEGIVLKSEWLHNWTLPPTGLKYAGVDPKGEGSDLFAISTWQHNPQLNKLYLWDVWAENVSQLEGLIKLKQLHQTHAYTRIFFESNALQKSLLNHPELKGLPTVPTVTDANKERRLISMSSHFQSSRVEVNPLMNTQRSEFWNEWVQFPRGQHDCALDACEVVTRNLISSGEFAFKFR